MPTNRTAVRTMHEAEKPEPLVIVTETFNCEAGFASDNEPQVFPTIVGRPKDKGVNPNERYVGDEAHTKRDNLRIKYPIEHGQITNWDDMLDVWHHVFHNQLRVNPEDHPILHSERLHVFKYEREKITQIMFETYNIPALFLATQALMALYAAGRTTGMVFDVGESFCHPFPIYEGHLFPYGMSRLPLGGYDIHETLMAKILKKEALKRERWETEAFRAMKEKLCYVAHDFNKEMQEAATSESLKQSYELPDGRVITIGSDRFRAPECLFDPSMAGQETWGIHELLHNSYKRCHEDIRGDLYANTVLYGGTTMLPGLAQRLEKELSALAPPSTEINVIPPKSKHAVWMGGSIIASLPEFLSMCISKQEYDEHGPTLVHKKCF